MLFRIKDKSERAVEFFLNRCISNNTTNSVFASSVCSCWSILFMEVLFHDTCRGINPYWIQYRGSISLYKGKENEYDGLHPVLRARIEKEDAKAYKDYGKYVLWIWLQELFATIDEYSIETILDSSVDDLCIIILMKGMLGQKRRSARGIKEALNEIEEPCGEIVQTVKEIESRMDFWETIIAGKEKEHSNQ